MYLQVESRERISLISLLCQPSSLLQLGLGGHRLRRRRRETHSTGRLARFILEASVSVIGGMFLDGDD